MRGSATATLTVTQYATQVARAVRAVGAAVVEGEVQKPKITPRGMLCFDLTDGESRLACKVFRGQVGGLEHRPRHGDLVKARVERPDLWVAGGRLDLIVTDIRLAGEGELLRRRAELLERLDAEGLCDPARRRPLPELPRAVGVIAGRHSDGMSDVVRALTDRFPPVHVVTCASLVQGKAAPRDIIDALARLQDHPSVDVIVIARGGGSVQDLVPFDDERLCRAIFACEKPVVTAIGHTDNVPVCNHVAWAALTPSRSAEMAVPSAVELRQRLQLARRAIDEVPARLGRLRERGEALAALVDSRVERVSRLGERVEKLSGSVDARAAAFSRELEQALDGERRLIDAASGRLLRAGDDVREATRRLAVGIRRQLRKHEHDYGHALARMAREAGGGLARRTAHEEERIAHARELAHERAGRRLEEATRGLRHVAAVVEARDFRRRGYVVAADEQGAPVSSAASLRPGARLRLGFSDGRATAVVHDIEEERLT